MERLATREQGDWYLARLVAGAVRNGHVFALLMIDVPDDDELVARFESVLRGADVLARWERGRLLALLPDTGREGAARAAERLREAAGEVAVEIGAAHWAGDTVPDLLERAHFALVR